MKDLVLLYMIISPSEEKKYVKVLNKYKVHFKTVMHGTGTASSSILEYFGLDEIDKTIIISVVPKIMSKHILMDMHKKDKIYEPGKGIAFTVPLSSSTKYILDMYNDFSLEDIKMKEANKHLIVTISNEGYAESIMSAAKKAGATGGTTINGRGLETEKVIKILGISIEPEKDIVLILASDDKKNDIMNEIVDKCGLKTRGAGICFSLPVDHVVGLSEEIE